jgi:hypothetical protein
LWKRRSPKGVVSELGDPEQDRGPRGPARPGCSGAGLPCAGRPSLPRKGFRASPEPRFGPPGLGGDAGEESAADLAASVQEISAAVGDVTATVEERTATADKVSAGLRGPSIRFGWGRGRYGMAGAGSWANG